MAKQNVHRFEIKLSLNDPEEYELYRILTNRPEKYSTNKQFYLDIMKAGVYSIASDETDNSVLQAAKEEARKAAIEETHKILEPIFGGLKILDSAKEERKTSYESEDRFPSSRMTSIADQWG